MKYRQHLRFAAALLLAAALLAGVALTGCSNESSEPSAAAGTIPDVAGMQPAEAVRALQEAGFLLGAINIVYTNAVPKGTAVSTNPAAGTDADEGTLVDIAFNTGLSTTVTLPSLTGLPQADAESIVTTIGLIPVVVESNSETVAAGTVMAQSPGPEAVVDSGSSVIIQVSKGKAAEKVAVPDVVGKKEADAVKALEDAKFKVKTYEMYSDTVAKGVVGAQLPEAGTKATVGSEVQIAVSLGKGTGAATVPKVIGKTEADAVSAIESAQLKATVYRAYSESVAKGVVIAQLPDGGATAAKGSEVGIQVSLGKAPAEPTDDNIEVPDVIGKTEADATAALTSAGFVAKAVGQASTVATGTVFAQLPVGTSKAPAGSTVAIAVSTGGMQPK